MNTTEKLIREMDEGSNGRERDETYEGDTKIHREKGVGQRGNRELNRN